MHNFLRVFFSQSRKRKLLYVFHIPLIETRICFAILEQQTSDGFIFRLEVVGYTRPLCLHNCNVNFNRNFRLYEDGNFARQLMREEDRSDSLSASRVLRWRDPRLQHPRKKKCGANEFLVFCILLRRHTRGFKAPTVRSLLSRIGFSLVYSRAASVRGLSINLRLYARVCKCNIVNARIPGRKR